jgi:hypothetical protein
MRRATIEDRVSDEGDHLYPAAAARALHHVDSEHPTEQGRPIEAAVAMVANR